MKRIALLTTLVIAGSSLVASADDRRPTDRDRYGERDNWPDRDRYDRYDNSRWSREFRGRWVTLADGQRGYQQIILRGRGGRIDRLRLEGRRGAPVIEKVTIEFMDNSTPQVVPINTRLTRGEGEVIRLNNNRGVKRIIVYGEPRNRGSYTVYGA